jgi:hypothetical protein
MTNVDLGFQSPLSFSPTQHQGCTAGQITQVQGGKWVAQTGWQKFLPLPDLTAK